MDIDERQVRATLGVVEDPQFGDPPRERVGYGLVVFRADAQQHDEPALDLADRVTGDPNPRARRSLKKCPHAGAAQRFGAVAQPCSAA